jgi:predicted nucleotidyltransferase
MALMLTRIEVEDYDAWKSMFDEDESRVRRGAKGYRIARGVENPNELFIQVEFPSADEAKSARERLLSSGVLERFAGRTGPTIVDVAEKVSY